MKKLLPPRLFFISIVLMVGLNWLYPVYDLISFPLNLIGILPLVTGLAFSISGSRKFLKVGTNIKTFNEPGKLVKDGLFKYSRNPMYLGFVLALSGISLILETVSSFIILAAFILITDKWYIAYEEKMMTKKFGFDYEEYKSVTRRWI